jgi:hypothetical protein
MESLSKCMDSVATMSEQLTHRMDSLVTTIDKQNAIILAMQRDFQNTIATMSAHIHHSNNPSDSLPHFTPASSTSMHRHWGEGPK